MLRRKKSFLSSIERFLLRLVVLAFAAFFVGQIITAKNPVDRIASVFEGFDGIGLVNEVSEPVQETFSEEAKEGEIVLALVNYSSLQKAKVLINGKTAGNFLNKYISLQVEAGDILEIDGTFYNHPVKVKVLRIDDGIKGFKEGQGFTVNGEILTLGEIRFKENPAKETGEPVSLPVPGI